MIFIAIRNTSQRASQGLCFCWCCPRDRFHSPGKWSPLDGNFTFGWKFHLWMDILLFGGILLGTMSHLDQIHVQLCSIKIFIQWKMARAITGSVLIDYDVGTFGGRHAPHSRSPSGHCDKNWIWLLFGNIIVYIFVVVVESIDFA